MMKPAKNRPSKSGSGSGSIMDEGRDHDGMNPMAYALERVRLVRTGNSFGFTVRDAGSSVLVVDHITEDGPVSRIQLGMVLLSIDGNRIRSIAHFNAVARHGQKSEFDLALARKRVTPFQADKFPIPEAIVQCAGSSYHLFRFDTRNGARTGMGIHQRRGSVFVSHVREGTAGKKVGVAVGDRILAVDGERVTDVVHCKSLVASSQGNPFDVLIEREQAPRTAGLPIILQKTLGKQTVPVESSQHVPKGQQRPQGSSGTSTETQSDD